MSVWIVFQKANQYSVYTAVQLVSKIYGQKWVVISLEILCRVHLSGMCTVRPERADYKACVLSFHGFHAHPCFKPTTAAILRTPFMLPGYGL